MGYRQYFMRVKKDKLNQIRDLNKEQFIKWAKDNSVEVQEEEVEDDFYDTYVDIHDIFDKVGACTVFEFGKHYENADKIVDLGKLLFKQEEVQEKFEDYYPCIVGKEAVECAIEWQRNKIVSYFKSLLLDDEEYKEINYFDTRTKEQRMEDAINSKIREWENSYCIPYNLDINNKNKLVNSWLYEYTIFDLVKLYKDTDWEKECLIFYGY